MNKLAVCCLSLFLTLGGVRINAAIYDCFMFFNELEILEIRLNELYDHVDKFVIVESVSTFTGKPKPLYFANNVDKFKKFHDKIIHIIVSDNPHKDPWAADFYQRNQIMRGLKGCHPDDIILISDADEIIRSNTIPLIIEELVDKGTPAVMCSLEYYRYFLNTWQNKSTNEVNTIATTYGHLRKTTPNNLRWDQRRNDLGFTIIPNAGWYFTSMGGVERFALKLSSFAHTEFNQPQYKTMDYIIQALKENGVIVPIDDTFPWWVVANRKHYEDIGFIYTGEAL